MTGRAKRRADPRVGVEQAGCRMTSEFRGRGEVMSGGGGPSCSSFLSSSSPPEQHQPAHSAMRATLAAHAQLAQALQNIVTLAQPTPPAPRIEPDPEQTASGRPEGEAGVGECLWVRLDGRISAPWEDRTEGCRSETGGRRLISASCARTNLCGRVAPSEPPRTLPPPCLLLLRPPSCSMRAC